MGYMYRQNIEFLLFDIFKLKQSKNDDNFYYDIESFI
ncbi:hypothetical protein C3B55_00794 [Candidatus Pseudomonas adelgestsugas]|uniref:Uncharacterized protein n=1 Tax=Candidatus Pseudomonas adelgestsugas TaxID=1302376 RepID=A0ABX5R8Z3_9PSED|nr:hypothetical protein C3B55_00794 [Candidatus Pseudomonas adelgestsugas]